MVGSYFERTLSRYDLTVSHTENGKELGPLSEKADVLISMWFNEITAWWAQYFPEKKIISYLRRYEMWSRDILENMMYSSINAVIFVSEYYRFVFEDLLTENKVSHNIKTYVIPNAVDLDEIPFREKPEGTQKIAFVCAVKDVKNFPLAMQILRKLPSDYKIYQIGLSLEKRPLLQLLSYRGSLGLNDRFFFPDMVPTPAHVYEWLKDKDFILSTSINEGNPMNIIEAMAMGIKPIIHAWPGAREQFPGHLIFDTVDEAVKLIESPGYTPDKYRQWVNEKYSMANYDKLHDVIEEVCA